MRAIRGGRFYPGRSRSTGGNKEAVCRVMDPVGIVVEQWLQGDRESLPPNPAGCSVDIKPQTKTSFLPAQHPSTPLPEPGKTLSYSRHTAYFLYAQKEKAPEEGARKVSQSSKRSGKSCRGRQWLPFQNSLSNRLKSTFKSSARNLSYSQ
jgi:hypothetical protein